jgi:hypothetical protein
MYRSARTEYVAVSGPLSVRLAVRSTLSEAMSMLARVVTVCEAAPGDEEKVKIACHGVDDRHGLLQLR